MAKNRYYLLYVLLSMALAVSAPALAQDEDHMPPISQDNERPQGPQEIPKQEGPRRIIPMGKLSVLGAYSDTNKGKGLWGYDISGYFAPAVRMDDTNYLIPLYNASLKRMRQYVTQEEGGRLYNTWQLHNGSVALRHQFSDEMTGRATVFGALNYVKETKDESFGKGLYDYEDWGASLDLRHKLTDMREKKSSAYSGSVEYYHRKYPHYQSLISLAPQTAPETHEKDFDAVKFCAGAERKAADAFNWEFKPSLTLKYFIDKKLIDSGGVLEDKKRKDYVISAILNGMYPLKEGRWEIGLDNTLDYNHSNLGFYDTTTSPDTFTDNYYTYLAFITYPYITYNHPVGSGKTLSLRAGYSYLQRDYTDRKAQESSGTYTDKKQKDKEHALHLLASYPITASLSWVTSFDYMKEKSNQKYEQYYWYSYDVYQIQSGLSFEF